LSGAGVRVERRGALAVLRLDKARGNAIDEGLVEGGHGVLLVRGALAHVECRVRSFHEEGDHTVWVGEVIALSSRRGRPLVYQAGAYRKLAPESSRGGASGPDRV